jgi:NADH-quinone oxidoreductase subunit J
MSLEQLFPYVVFFGFAATLVSSALMLVVSRNPVRCALFLVLAFFASTGLWILLEIEFLGLILILVYVGAVMTLFLFVVMTLNIDKTELRREFIRYIPYGIIIVAMFVALLVYVIRPENFGGNTFLNIAQQPEHFSNIKELGNVLYTQYAYPFEIAGVLLLVAIIAAISLTFRGKQTNKNISPEKQIDIRLEDRIRLVNMKSERKT